MRMRRLNVSKKGALKVVKEFDAFPKVQEDCKEMSASRGGCKSVLMNIKECSCSCIQTGNFSMFTSLMLISVMVII